VRNVSNSVRRENQIVFYVQKLFSDNGDVYAIRWKYTVRPEWPHVTTI